MGEKYHLLFISWIYGGGAGFLLVLIIIASISMSRLILDVKRDWIRSKNLVVFFYGNRYREI